jgi:hypothetical protein
VKKEDQVGVFYFSLNDLVTQLPSAKEPADKFKAAVIADRLIFLSMRKTLAKLGDAINFQMIKARFT